MPTRRGALLAAGAVATTSCALPQQGRAQLGDPAKNPPPGLGQIARERGLTFGSAVQANLLESDGFYADAYAREAGILVPEFEGKWSIVQPAEGTFDFRMHDALVRWGAARGRPTRGHCLVWHNAMPGWLRAALDERPTRARAVLEAHIGAVLAHTREAIRDWDVVNEAVANPPGSDVPQTSAGEMRDTPWLRALEAVVNRD